MNFANLTPAERMKASGLIGLIVVVVFFVVYTMMGTLGGKKPPTSPPAGSPEQQASTAIPEGPLAPNPGTPADGSNPFPVGSAQASNPSPKDQELYHLDDPFKPIRGKPIPNAAAASAMNGGERPNVQILPAVQSRPLPTFGQPASRGPASVFPFGNPGINTRPAGEEPEKPEPPKFMPEIQVVGVVHGQPSVATLKVEGHVITARPGDLIAKGHRLVTVNDEGVVIRAHGELTSLRVGAGVNNSKSEAAAG